MCTETRESHEEADRDTMTVQSVQVVSARSCDAQQLEVRSKPWWSSIGPNIRRCALQIRSNVVESLRDYTAVVGRLAF